MVPNFNVLGFYMDWKLRPAREQRRRVYIAEMHDTKTCNFYWKIYLLAIYTTSLFLNVYRTQLYINFFYKFRKQIYRFVCNIYSKEYAAIDLCSTIDLYTMLFSQPVLIILLCLIYYLSVCSLINPRCNFVR